MHSNFAGAEPRRIRSVHFRAPDGAAVLAAAHGEHKVAAITTAGKPVGTNHTGGNVMYVLAVGRPNDAGNTIGAADAAGDLARRREGGGAAEACDPQASS